MSEMDRTAHNAAMQEKGKRRHDEVVRALVATFRRKGCKTETPSQGTESHHRMQVGKVDGAYPDLQVAVKFDKAAFLRLGDPIVTIYSGRYTPSARRFPEPKKGFNFDAIVEHALSRMKADRDKVERERDRQQAVDRHEPMRAALEQRLSKVAGVTRVDIEVSAIGLVTLEVRCPIDLAARVVAALEREDAP